jgi:hypothetical protein
VSGLEQDEAEVVSSTLLELSMNAHYDVAMCSDSESLLVLLKWARDPKRAGGASVTVAANVLEALSALVQRGRAFPNAAGISHDAAAVILSRCGVWCMVHSVSCIVYRA